jgi:PleD family two-component response regulator
VILPETDAEGAWRMAERMREAVEALRIPRVGEGAP